MYKNLSAGTLSHGGVMVNYQCSAACRHCLYSCSPTRGPASSNYVSDETAEKICLLLNKGGCRSVHIGGGEPFLDFDRLLVMVQKLKQTGIKLEYIETNAFWAAGTQGSTETQKDTQKEVMTKLETLLTMGVDCLCISVDPFHAEYVPYGAPLALARLCDKIGMNYFLWRHVFLSVLSGLDSKKTHSRADMEKTVSKKYLRDTASIYGIEYGGRAVNIEREFGKLLPAASFVVEDSPCYNLLSTEHFHVDMEANFIPPRCTGLCIPLSEVLEGIPQGKYLVFETLYSGGISALMRLAVECGFSPDVAGYPSRCNLCFHLRHFLSANNFKGKSFPELDRNHYEEAFKYY